MTKPLAPGWKDVTTMLPSKGRFYSSRLLARPYSLAEIRSVSENAEMRDPVAGYKNVLAGLQFEDESDVGQVFLGDFFFVSFYRKVITTGTREFTLQNVLSGWNSEPLTADRISFKEIKAPDLPVHTEILGEPVEFRPLTVGQWLSFYDEHDQHPEISDVISLMSGGAVNPAEVFDPDETAVLGEVVDLLDFGMEPVQLTMTSEGGDKTRTVEVDLDSSEAMIVLPFRRPDSAPQSRIRFGRQDATVS